MRQQKVMRAMMRNEDIFYMALPCERKTSMPKYNLFNLRLFLFNPPPFSLNPWLNIEELATLGKWGRHIAFLFTKNTVKRNTCNYNDFQILFLYVNNKKFPRDHGLIIFPCQDILPCSLQIYKKYLRNSLHCCSSLP